MSDAIYLVIGRTGEYSDRSEWTVCWFPTREEAEAHRDLCQRESDGLDSDAWNDAIFDEPWYSGLGPRPDPLRPGWSGASIEMIAEAQRRWDELLRLRRIDVLRGIGITADPRFHRVFGHTEYRVEEVTRGPA